MQEQPLRYTARWLTTSEQGHLYAAGGVAKGIHCPVWNQCAVFDGDYTRSGRSGKVMLYDALNKARVIADKLNGGETPNA